MRRSPIAKRTTLLFLILSGLFNLFSYSLDQMVVQQEDNIRAITREMNLQKTELDTLRQSLNTLEDLTFSTGRYSNEFLYSIASTQRFVEFFNIHSKSIKEIEDRFRKIYTEESIAKINKEYQKNFHNLISEINTRMDEILKNFSYTFSSGKGYELIKDDIEFRKTLDFKKIPTDILKDFNFDKVESDESITKNNDIVIDIRNKTAQLHSLKAEMNFLSTRIIQPYYIKLFSDYFRTLDGYSSSLAKKNYYILFSILSQILGITFFLLLFRSILIEREKK
tara:strand:+ start:950 stop:1789 length:840 start_codon:yes stop_codon:yes gene_type:complete